jgi:hypothetical protein
MSTWINNYLPDTSGEAFVNIIVNKIDGSDINVSVGSVDQFNGFQSIENDINNFNNNTTMVNVNDYINIFMVYVTNVGKTFCRCSGVVNTNNTSGAITTYNINFPVTYDRNPGVRLSTNSVSGSAPADSIPGYGSLSTTGLNIYFSAGSNTKHVRWESYGYLP